MKHQPVPEADMEVVSPRYSICEVIRGIYKSTDDPKIKTECRIATAMAKAMSKKISDLLTDQQYWFVDFWDKNPRT